MPKPMKVGDGDVLIVVDIQNDFCPNGALAVPGGDEVVPFINRLAGRFCNVVLTQDWHPPDHFSFVSMHPGKQPYQTVQAPYGEQILWPDHCVRGTHGAAFHEDLDLSKAVLVVRKGFRAHIDSYSTFYENDRTTPTGLIGYLRERSLGRIFLAGLALDFCVRFSAEDARQEGFDVAVIEDACRGIDVEGSVEATRKSFSERGVVCINSDALE